MFSWPWGRQGNMTTLDRLDELLLVAQHPIAALVRVPCCEPPLGPMIGNPPFSMAPWRSNHAYGQCCQVLDGLEDRLSASPVSFGPADPTKHPSVLRPDDSMAPPCSNNTNPTALSFRFHGAQASDSRTVKQSQVPVQMPTRAVRKGIISRMLVGFNEPDNSIATTTPGDIAGQEDMGAARSGLVVSLLSWATILG